MTTDLVWPSGRIANWQEIRDYVLADFPACAICGTPDATEVDHIWPRYYGGTDESSNLQPTCGPCNRRKGSTVDPSTATSGHLSEAVAACVGRAFMALAEAERFLAPLVERSMTEGELGRNRMRAAQDHLSALRDEIAVHHAWLGDAAAHEPYGPLVCVCPEPQADLARNFGECQSCYRKPLALMGVKS